MRNAKRVFARVAYHFHGARAQCSKALGHVIAQRAREPASRTGKTDALWEDALKVWAAHAPATRLHFVLKIPTSPLQIPLRTITCKYQMRVLLSLVRLTRKTQSCTEPREVIESVAASISFASSALRCRFVWCICLSSFFTASFKTARSAVTPLSSFWYTRFGRSRLPCKFQKDFDAAYTAASS